MSLRAGIARRNHEPLGRLFLKGYMCQEFNVMDVQAEDTVLIFPLHHHPGVGQPVRPRGAQRAVVAERVFCCLQALTNSS